MSTLTKKIEKVDNICRIMEMNGASSGDYMDVIIEGIDRINYLVGMQAVGGFSKKQLRLAEEDVAYWVEGTAFTVQDMATMRKQDLLGILELIDKGADSKSFEDRLAQLSYICENNLSDFLITMLFDYKSILEVLALNNKKIDYTTDIHPDNNYCHFADVCSKEELIIDSDWQKRQLQMLIDVENEG